MKVQKKNFTCTYLIFLTKQKKKSKSKKDLTFHLRTAPNSTVMDGWSIQRSVHLTTGHYTNIDLLVIIIMMLICHIKVITVENEKKNQSIDRDRSFVRSVNLSFCLVVLFKLFVQDLKKKIYSIPFHSSF